MQIDPQKIRLPLWAYASSLNLAKKQRLLLVESRWDEATRGIERLDDNKIQSFEVITIGTSGPILERFIRIWTQINAISNMASLDFVKIFFSRRKTNKNIRNLSAYWLLALSTYLCMYRQPLVYLISIVSSLFPNNSLGSALVTINAAHHHYGLREKAVRELLSLVGSQSLSPPILLPVWMCCVRCPNRAFSSS